MTPVQRNNAGKKVTLGGVLTALGLICIYLANLLPTTRLTFLAIGSMFIFVMVIEFGVRAALATYAATSLLAVAILPFNLLAILYIIFFGYYGVVKYYIEKINHLILEWVIKIIFFNLLMAGLYMLILIIPSFKNMMDTSAGAFTVWSTVALGEIAFIVYDYGYSIVISYYKNRLKKLLRF